MAHLWARVRFLSVPLGLAFGSSPGSLGQALAAYEERELPALKAEKPGLKLRQYKQMIYEQASACDLVL